MTTPFEPSITDFTLYTGTPLTSTDWGNNWNMVVTYFNNGKNASYISMENDFTATTASFIARTGCVVSLLTRASGRVVLSCNSAWGQNNSLGRAALRINVDSGASYYYLPTCKAGMNTYELDRSNSTIIITGLTAATHTFQLEVETNGYKADNNIASAPYSYYCNLSVVEL